MSYPEKFYDLLFEVSNEYRHSLMLELRKQPNRITELSKKMEMTSQEVSRHLNRLSEISLIYKDTDGYFSLTSLGETVLVLLEVSS